VDIQNLNVKFARSGLDAVANIQFSARYDHNATRAKNTLRDELMSDYERLEAILFKRFVDRTLALGQPGGPLAENKSSFLSFNQTVDTPRGPFGVTSTCHVNVVTRQGANEFHGSLFEHFAQERAPSAVDNIAKREAMIARIFSPNRNRTVRTGIINHTEEAYEALLSFAMPLFPFLGNTPPTMTIPADQTVPVGGDSGALPVVVADDATDAASLVLTAGSSNQAVVRNSDITLGGSGANRTVRIRPSGGRAGQASIGLSLRDGTYSKTLTFTLSTNPP
jgi:hypothetical protein